MALKEEYLFCNNCRKFLCKKERIKMEKDAISDRDKRYNITPQTCPECRKEIRKAAEEFEGDYSPLHPEETILEFEEHENHEKS